MITGAVLLAGGSSRAMQASARLSLLFLSFFLQLNNFLANVFCYIYITSYAVTLLTTAAVLVSQAEAIVRSLTNMAAADSNGYLKSNYMLNINNSRTKHYIYSYIHARTFTTTEPVSLSNPTMQPCLLAKPVDGFKGCSNWT